MDTELLQSINSGFYKRVAELHLVGIEVEEGKEVETCVKLDFDDDVSKFKRFAEDFTSNAYGVAG